MRNIFLRQAWLVHAQEIDFLINQMGLGLQVHYSLDRNNAVLAISPLLIVSYREKLLLRFGAWRKKADSAHCAANRVEIGAKQNTRSLQDNVLDGAV